MSCVKYNNVIDVQYEPVDSAMPISLADMKRQINLLFESEGGFEVNDDDTYIEQFIIPAAVAAVEKYTGRLLRPCNVQAEIRNEKGGQSLPYGPVTSAVTAVDADGDAITNIKTTGLQFKSLTSPTCTYALTTYTAGYAAGEVPAGLIMAGLHQGAFLYRFRGDQEQQYASSEVGMSASAKALAHPYKRTVWLL